MQISIVFLILIGILIVALIRFNTSQVADMAVAVFKGDGDVIGETTFRDMDRGCRVEAVFTKLPPGLHGFHIHVAGDLRGEGCKGACAHYHKGSAATRHGGAPGSGGERHTGDLGNVRVGRYTYFLAGVKVADLWGRSLIVHGDPDDLGLGGHEDSHITGHSGARIACAIIGRVAPCKAPAKTRRNK